MTEAEDRARQALASAIRYCDTNPVHPMRYHGTGWSLPDLRHGAYNFLGVSENESPFDYRKRINSYAAMIFMTNTIATILFAIWLITAFLLVICQEYSAVSLTAAGISAAGILLAYYLTRWRVRKAHAPRA